MLSLRFRFRSTPKPPGIPYSIQSNLFWVCLDWWLACSVVMSRDPCRMLSETSMITSPRWLVTLNIGEMSVYWRNTCLYWREDLFMDNQIMNATLERSWVWKDCTVDSNTLHTQRVTMDESRCVWSKAKQVSPTLWYKGELRIWQPVSLLLIWFVKPSVYRQSRQIRSQAVPHVDKLK